MLPHPWHPSATSPIWSSERLSHNYRMGTATPWRLAWWWCLKLGRFSFLFQGILHRFFGACKLLATPLIDTFLLHPCKFNAYSLYRATNSYLQHIYDKPAKSLLRVPFTESVAVSAYCETNLDISNTGSWTSACVRHTTMVSACNGNKCRKRCHHRRSSRSHSHEVLMSRAGRRRVASNFHNHIWIQPSHTTQRSRGPHGSAACTRDKFHVA